MNIILIILLIFVLLCIGVTTFLLLSPLRLIIDSDQKIAVIGWNKWINARLLNEGKSWGIRTKLPFWNHTFLIEELIANHRSKKDKVKPHKKDKKKKSKWTLSKMRRIWSQIKITEFRWILDTDDYVWNAYLTPIFSLFSYKTGYPARINFMGKNEIRINAKSRIINMLVAGIL